MVTKSEVHSLQMGKLSLNLAIHWIPTDTWVAPEGVMSQGFSDTHNVFFTISHDKVYRLIVRGPSSKNDLL